MGTLDHMQGHTNTYASTQHRWQLWWKASCRMDTMALQHPTKQKRQCPVTHGAACTIAKEGNKTIQLNWDWSSLRNMQFSLLITWANHWNSMLRGEPLAMTLKKVLRFPFWMTRCSSMPAAESSWHTISVLFSSPCINRSTSPTWTQMAFVPALLLTCSLN